MQDVHYFEKHIVGTTGGNNDDQKEALALMEKQLIHPETLITHIRGLDAAGPADIIAKNNGNVFLKI